MNKRFVIACVAGLAILGGLIWWATSQVTLNFTLLAILLLLMIIMVPIWYYRSEHGGYSAQNRADMASFCAFLLLAFTGLAFWTLDNYFYPDRMIYRNSDHHAVRIDGVKIKAPAHFVLAENSKHAFFDGEGITGRASIASVGDEAVTLKTKGFSRALYMEHYNEKTKCLNRLSLSPEQKNSS